MVGQVGVYIILVIDQEVYELFSFFRHEFGSFYPANDDGFYTMIGEGPGAGYNINVPWENGRCGDADYFAVWDHILVPVAKEFNPDIIVVSAGFDAGIHSGTLEIFSSDQSIFFFLLFLGCALYYSSLIACLTYVIEGTDGAI